MEPLRIKMSIDELAFVIAPPGHIKSDVSVLKDDVHFLIGRPFDDMYVKAHVALFKFNEEAYFDDITRHVEDVAAHFTPFNIFLKDLSVLYTGASRMIVMNILNKYPVREIFEKLVRKNIRYVPHISIASKLSPADLLRAWPYLKDFSYSQHFTCDRIAVFARVGPQWTLYREIPFGPN
jgi:2'-5' RNA ligase